MLDTNIASFIIRGASETLKARLAGVPMASLCVSAITEGELRYGLARRPEASALGTAVEAFLQRVDVLPWNSAAAATYGTLRAALDAAGTPLGNLDTLIAAHAWATNSTLVSNDRAIGRALGLQPDGVRVEDWTIA